VAGDFVFLRHGVPHRFDVVDGPARKLIIAVLSGIEESFDDLVNGVDPATIPPPRCEVSRLTPIPPGWRDHLGTDRQAPARLG